MKSKRALFLGAPRTVRGWESGEVLKAWYSATQNTGNLLIGYSLARQLDMDLVDYKGSFKPDQIRAECELVVIAAANFANPYFDLTAWADLIEAVDLPCLMVGLGAQAPHEGSRIQLQPGTRRFLKAVADRTKRIGVRGAFTAQVMSDLRIKNVEPTGCPSLYMDLGAVPACKPVDATNVENFVVNASRDVVVHAMDQERMTFVVEEIYRQAFDHRIPLVLQTEVDEINILDKRLPEPELALAAQRIQNNLRSMAKLPRDAARSYIEQYAKIFFDIAEWRAFLAPRAVSVGTRFHGNLMAMHAGVPAMFLCHDARTQEMCEWAGLPHLLITQVDNMRLSALAEQIDASAFEARIGPLTRAYAEFLEANRVPHRIKLAEDAAHAQ